MNRTKLSLIAALVLMVGVSTGCDSLLEVEPQQSVSPGVATGSPEGVRAVKNSVYNRITHFNYYGRQLMIVGDALADNGIGNPISSGRFVSEPVNQIGTGVGGWNRYLQINEINTVLAHAPNAGLDTAEEARIMGEMYFHRALAYHDLVKVYAYEPNQIIKNWSEGVIIRLEPSETIDVADQDLPRSSVTEVYQQIERDLLASIQSFDVADNTNRFYANKAAAEALLARVYLYWERWADAESYATRAMNNTGASLASADDVAEMFQSGSSPMGEALFELRYTLTEGQGVNESIQSLVTPPGHYDLLPAPEFLATFDALDARNDLYPVDSLVYPTENSAVGHRFLAKYMSAAATPWVDNIPILRYAEVLLTRAEARAEQGNTAGALEDLNRLRVNRGLEAVDGLSGAALINEILAERRRELAFEGHRWHDLKRRGLDINKPAASGGGTLSYDAIQILSRLPIEQVDLNPNLNQNPGY